MDLDHIAIWAQNLEQEKDFYVKYFACKANHKYENPEKHFTSYFLTFPNGARIELMHKDEIHVGSNKDSFGFCHIAINVGTNDEVDSLTKTLAQDGYQIESLPRKTGDGYYESVILDPEGNKIELTAMADYKITKANAKDLEAILYLQKCCYLSEAEIYNDYSISPLTHTIEDIQKDFEHQIILKLEYNNRIVGSIRGCLSEGTCYVGKLIVDKYCQNMGFGKQLMLTIEDTFHNALRFELFTGSKSEKNLYLYRKLGYKEFREERMNDNVRLVYLEKVVENKVS
jgi:catechol 2,3-dioxygenase-like lactoylglutathione lyase family enzyme/ribosomal protein S18 acetylase RimI-like enzyme